MSEENVEIVRAAYNAFERGDLEGVSQFQAPTIEWQTSVEDPDAATHRGRVAVRRYIEGYMETFPGLRAGLEECVEASGDKVLATVRYTGRARTSGMDMDWRQWLVYTLKDGLIVWLGPFQHRCRRRPCRLFGRSGLRFSVGRSRLGIRREAPADHKGQMQG